MGNLDHIQRVNADKESCQNCFFSSIKFRNMPCCNCKGTTDMHVTDLDKPAVLTGKDLGYK